MSLPQLRDLPDFDPQEILKLFLEKKKEAIAARYLKVLDVFENRLDTQYSQSLKQYIEQFLNNFFYIFSQSQFILNNDFARLFITRNRTIANLAAVSPFRTTDIFLEILVTQSADLNKILTLYSPRNEVHVDYNKLFRTNPELSSYWYSQVLSHHLTGLPNEKVYRKLRDHCAYDHPALKDFFNKKNVYLGATYIHQELDKVLKYRLNLSLQNVELRPTVEITSSSRKQKIAVVSAGWHPKSSTYRKLFAYLATLSPKYHLTLINVGGDRHEVDDTLFEQVIHCEMSHGKFDTDEILAHEFSVVYFVEVGATPESIMLANSRLAPIQCAGSAHPVSSHGAQIDYYLSGQETEMEVEAEKFYSEQLVLLPGSGVIHQPIEYEHSERPMQADRLVINCPWSAPKVNAPLLRALKKISEKLQEPPLFRFFCGDSFSENSYLTFVQDVATILPREYFEVIPELPYEDYMALMEAGAIALDSFPMGGCNSVVDSLYLRKPTVVYEGKRLYNRQGSAILRQVGLHELIAQSEKEFIQIALKLLLDEAYRQQIGDRLKALNLQEILFNTDDAKYFKKAIDYLIDHHNELQRDAFHTPVVIERDKPKITPRLPQLTDLIPSAFL